MNKLKQIPESGRIAIARVERLLLEGYTGTIQLECSQGGVPEVKESRVFRTKDLQRESA